MKSHKIDIHDLGPETGGELTEEDIARIRGGATFSLSYIEQENLYSTTTRWNFTNAWPSKVSGPQPKSDG